MSLSKGSTRTMFLFAVLFMIAVAERTQPGVLNNNEDKLKDVVMATVNSYDIDKSFLENFFSLLYTICPRSVQCHDRNATELSFSRLVDRFNDTFHLSEGFILERNATLIDESRRYLKTSFSNLQNCCTKCYCTNECTSRNNCCPLNNADEKPNIDRLVAAEQHCIFPTVYETFYHRDTKGKSFYMISDCLNRSTGEDVIRKCKYPSRLALPEMIPVYSESTNYLYRNKYCAMCNNIIVWISWRLTSAIPDVVNLSSLSRVLSSGDGPYQQLLSSRRYFTLSIEPTYEVSDEFRCTIPENDIEPVCTKLTFLNAHQQCILQFACSYHLSAYQARYRNVFCYMCDYNKRTSEDMCTVLTPKLSVKSFTGLLAVHDMSAENDKARTSQDNSCTCREYFDTEQDTCRPLICPLCKTYFSCTCEALIENITGLAVKLVLDIVPETPSTNVVNLISETTTENIVRKVEQIINTVFKNEWGPMEIQLIFMNSERSLSDSSHLKFHVILIIRSKWATDNMVLLKDVYDFIHSKIRITFLKTPMIMSLGKVVGMHNLYQKSFAVDYESASSKDIVFDRLYSASYIKTNAPYIISYLTKLLFCTRITLNDEEFVLLSNSSSLNVDYSDYDTSHIFDAEERQMCFDDFIIIFQKPNSSACCYCSNLTTKVYLIVLLIELLI